MIRRFKDLKIRTQSAVVIMCAILIASAFFEVMWQNKWNFFEAVTQMKILRTQIDDEKFRDTLAKEALHYNIPESEDDVESVKALEPFLNLADEYNGIYIYGLEDGLYRAGRYPSFMDNNTFSVLFNLGYRFTGGEGEFIYEFPLEFANGIAQIMVYNYQRVLYIYPYMLVCLFLSVALFLSIVLFFLNTKMRQILVLKDEILLMSAGDLTHSLPDYGKDEIGILSQELDLLRESLHDHIQKEQESRQANQDLITALSHDLRTPLTILKGYLEVIKYKKNPRSQEIYLDRCLKKTEDIKDLTDRMFEYALVAEEEETPNLIRLSTDFIRQCLTENCDFIRLTGFTANTYQTEATGTLLGDKTMLKRIFNNLFSNILKYGNKNVPVSVSEQIQGSNYIVSITNAIKNEDSSTDNNNIGLKNVDRMIRLLDGEIKVRQKQEWFEVELWFPLQ